MTQFPSRKFLFWLFLVLGSIVLGLIVSHLLLSIAEKIRAELRREPHPLSLEPALLPTAQFLYEHPQRLPVDVKVDLSNTRNAFSRRERELCVLLRGGPEHEYRVRDFYLDGTATGYVYARETPLERDQGWIVGLCLLPVSSMTKGLHILEIHLARKFGDTPKIYQLALKIE